MTDRLRRFLSYPAIAVIVALMLVACAAPFDHNEHANLVSINQAARDSKILCSDLERASSTARIMAMQSEWVWIYSSNLNGNADMTKMAKNLMDMAKELDTRFQQSQPPSRLYCTTKVDNIKQATDIMLKVSGRRAR